MWIKDHGLWMRYTPEKPPKDAPAGAMFARREEDGVDWYPYSSNPNNFIHGTIKLTMTGTLVLAAVTDPTWLWPANCTVLEIGDVYVSDPQREFGGKVYDAEKQTFHPAPPNPHVDPVPDILRRLEALENK